MEVLKVANESLVVLYESENGRIVHTHKVVTFQGAEHPDKATPLSVLTTEGAAMAIPASRDEQMTRF